MPVSILDNTEIEFPRFAIVGTYHSYPALRASKWVMHASMLRGRSRLRQLSPAQVCHMCPPLQLGAGSRHDLPQYDTTPADLIGTIQLDQNDMDGINTWIEYLNTRTPTVIEGIRPLEQYVLCPPMDPAKFDSVTGTMIYMRFSCVGFVLYCYQMGANVHLLDWQNGRYPRMGLGDLTGAYSSLMQRRQEIGLDGPGPWPVALPGHLFHALMRPEEEVRRRPYLPREGTEVYFQARSGDPLTAAEHAEAERIAYFYALDRGGGHLPPYDPALAHDEFCRAAVEVIARRPL